MLIGIFSSTIKRLAHEKNCTLDEAAGFVKSLGVTSAELSSSELRSPDYPDYRAVLDRHGISVSCVHHGASLGSADDAVYGAALLDTLHLVDEAAKAGASFVMILPVQTADVADMGADRQRALERSAEALRYIAAYAHTLGITIIIENISREILPFSTVSDLKYLAENVPFLRLNYDVGNFRCVAIDVLEAYEALKPYFVFSHIKDWNYTDEGGLVAKDGAHLVDAYHGQGVLPFDEILSRLKRDGYNGWYIIEQGANELEQKLPVSVALLKKYDR